MSSVEERVEDLAEEHLGISDRSALDANVSELDVNSMDTVNFLKTINQEFSVNISPGEAANFSRLRDLVNHFGWLNPTRSGHRFLNGECSGTANTDTECSRKTGVGFAWLVPAVEVSGR